MRGALLSFLLVSLASAPLRAVGVEHAQLRAVTALSRMAFGHPATCQDGTTVVQPNWQFLGPPTSHYPELFSGSPNHKLLARVWYYGWALRAPGTAAQKTEARNLLLEHFANQDAWGQYSISSTTDEILTSSHFQLWAAGVSGAYVLALANGGVIQQGQNPHATGDAPVRDAARRWWLAEKALWDKLQIFVGGQARIDAPGARVIFTGPVELRDLTNLLVRGQIPAKQQQWWSQCYNASAWMMRELNAKAISPSVLGSPRPGEPVAIQLHDTLCIYRKGQDFVYSFPTLRAAVDPLFWVARIGGVMSYGPLQSGKPVFPAVPPPQLPGPGVPTVEPLSGVVAGAASCPPL